MNARTPTGRLLQTPLIALAMMASLAAAAHAEEGGRSVLADPSLAYGDWAERVPLEMPRAARGVAPELALVASHRTTESDVGAGWRLQAGSVIRRRSPSNGVPKYEAGLAESLFLVDGMELVAVTDPGVDHYQPETYDGSRYDYVPSSNTWMRKRDGWTWTYGDTAANATRAIALVPQTLPICAAPCNTEAWFLRSVVDPFGNRIDYAYTVTAMPVAMASAYTGYPSTSRDHLISTITYGAGTAVVTFTYGTQDRPDVTVDLSGGFPVVHHRRLTQIRSTAGGKMFSKYVFQYEDQGGNDATLGTLTDCDNVPTVAAATTARSLLRKLHRVSDTATAPKKVIRCNRYHHEHHEDIGWEGGKDLTALIADPFSDFDPLEDSWTPVPVEIDGDGRTDLVMLAYSEFGDNFTHHKVFIATPFRPEPFAPAGGGGDAGVFAAEWEAELDATVGPGIFGNRLGRALGDIDGDSIPEIIVELGGGVTIKKASPVNSANGMLAGVGFAVITNDLVNCDLRYGELADVDGDRKPDLVVRAHGGSVGCGDEPETTWIRNLGDVPWFVSADKLPLSVPLELGVAPPGWDEALGACANGTVAPPLDYNQDWSTEGYLADQARFDDFNHDGVLDVAYALYACWTVANNRWLPDTDSVYSRIFFGTGKGSFVDSGLSAGAPVLLDPLDWGGRDTDDTRITGGTLAAIDLDRDGRAELLQSNFSSGSGFGFGWASCSSVVPPTQPEDGGFGVSPYALLTEHEIVGYAGPAWDCNELATTPAWGDFDGDGFLDIITISGGEDGYWYAELRRSTREVSEGRLVASDNEHGGRSKLTWGFSAQLPNSNPELVINLEVLQSVTGPGGTRALTYHGAVLRGDQVTPFAEVTVTGDRGGIEAYSFVTSPWGLGKQHLGVRYRENGSVEHVTVLLNGTYSNGLDVSGTRPYFNPLVRRCEYDVGFAPINLDTADDDCRELAWLAPSVPQTGGFPADHSIEVTDDNYSMLLGRDRKTDTPERQAIYAKVWRAAGAHTAPPRASRVAALSPGQAIDQAIVHTVPVIGDDFYRWPVPAALSSKIPDVEAEEAAYSYDLFLGGSPAVYAWDYAYDHPVRKLAVRYEHRDLSTNDDDRVVHFTWNQPSPTLGYWYQLLFEKTSDRAGNRLTQLERSQFSGFDSPRVVRTCGKASPADCETDQYQYFPNGTLKKHTRPDQSFESWTRLAWCGEPLTYRDPANRTTTFTRNTGGDAKCLTKSMRRQGATWRYTHDTLLRPIKLVVDPGAGVSATAEVTTTYYYDDSLTYQPTVLAREDWNYVEPRRAERRGDGQLQLYYTDGLGRIAKHTRCSDTGTNMTGGDIGLVACSKSTIRTLAWNLYGTDGLLKVAVAPFKTGEVPVTTGFGHDGQHRPIVVMEPVHAAGVVDWRVDTIKYGAGYEERTEPTAAGRVVTRRQHSTLGEALTLDGASRGSLTHGLVAQVTSVTAADGKTTRLSYDDRWQLASERRVDATGLPVRENCVMPDGTIQLRPYEHTITTRDLRGRVTEEVLPDDTVLSYAYDNVDRIVRRQINGVPVRSYTYVSPTLTAKGTVRVTDELGGSSATSSIDGLGRVWLETAPRVANRSVYDTTGRLASTTDIDNLSTQYFYDIHDGLTSVVTPATGTTTYARDGAGRITTVTDADGAVETYSYTYSGALYQHHRGPHLVTEHAYDARGLVVAAVEHGVDTAMTYDDLGRLTKRREGVDGASELRVTTYFYDAGDRLTEVRRTPVAGLQTASTLFHHDGWGRPWEEIDPAGLAIQRSFDAAGRVRWVRDQEGAVLETAYDDLGRITDRQVPGGGWEHVRYHGKQTHVGEPNVWRIDQYDDEDLSRGVKTQRFVDGTGHLLTELQPDGTRTAWTRPTGRVTRGELFTAGGTPKRATDYAYDATTGVLASRTQGPYAVSYEYTAAGRLARTITPDDVLERTYANGLLASTTEAGVQRRYGRDKTNGWITTEARQVGTGAIRSADIERDRLGRIGRIEWSNARTAPHKIQTFALHDYYDNAWLETNQGVAGSLTAIEASTFDGMGRPLTRTTSGAGLPRKTVSWNWYDNGTLESVTTPSSKLLEYDYGAPFDHQLDSVTLDGAVVAQVDARDVRGSITSMTLPAVGQTRTFGYDDNGRIASRTTGPLLPMLGFEWNATFNPDGTLATETIDDHAGGNGWMNEYTYDGAGRLIAEIAGKIETTFAYALDAAGNRETTTVSRPAAPKAVIKAGYDGPKLTTVGTTALVYDAWNAVAADHHGNTYTRSADGELTMIGGAGSTTVFARNARGIPVAAVEPGPVARRTTWGLSPEGLPLEVDEGDGAILTYLNVEGIHIGTAVNGAFASIDADDRGTELRHGTEVLGAATGFGAGTSAPPASDERFMYAMLERVPSAAGGVMLARRRTYDPTIGRFLEPDPRGSAGGLEVYQYAHGDPINFVDPMGTAELGTDCSTGGTPLFGPPQIEPMTPQTMDSGIPESVLDLDQVMAGITRHNPISWASHQEPPGRPRPPLDFPTPGPLCVVSCMGDLPPMGPEKPKPPPRRPPAPEIMTSPFALAEMARKAVQAVHETVWGTEAREAVGREALKRGSEWVKNMSGAPGRALEGAKQLRNQFRNDPAGTTLSVGTTVASEVTWEMVAGTVEDVIEGTQEYGTGLWDFPRASYDLYTAEDDAARQDAAERLFDAGGNLASGTYKLTGPITTVVGYGVLARGTRAAGRSVGLEQLDEVGVSLTPAKINVQKQAGHVPGTPQNINRVKQGKPTSTFHGEKSGEMATQIANERGAPVPGRPNVKEYEFGVSVGTGPSGGSQTRVRIHQSPKTGEIHGHPTGPEQF